MKTVILIASLCSFTQMYALQDTVLDNNMPQEAIVVNQINQQDNRPMITSAAIFLLSAYLSRLFMDVTRVAIQKQVHPETAQSFAPDIHNYHTISSLVSLGVGTTIAIGYLREAAKSHSDTLEEIKKIAHWSLGLTTAMGSVAIFCKLLVLGMEYSMCKSWQS